MTDNTSAPCPECGAAPIEGVGCWDMLGLVCAWEVDDPELAAAHFLTVTSYNLQHAASFTDDAIAGLRELFIDAIDGGLSAAELRRRAGWMFAGNRRVRRDPADRRPASRRWDMTIADVYALGPPGAAGRVGTWANAIRRDS